MARCPVVLVHYHRACELLGGGPGKGDLFGECAGKIFDSTAHISLYGRFARMLPTDIWKASSYLTLCFEDVTLQIVVRNGRQGRTASAYATKISLKHW